MRRLDDRVGARLPEFGAQTVPPQHADRADAVCMRRAHVVPTVADHRASGGIDAFAREQMGDELRLVVERSGEIGAIDAREVRSEAEVRDDPLRVGLRLRRAHVKHGAGGRERGDDLRDAVADDILAPARLGVAGAIVSERVLDCAGSSVASSRANECAQRRPDAANANRRPPAAARPAQASACRIEREMPSKLSVSVPSRSNSSTAGPRNGGRQRPANAHCRPGGCAVGRRCSR